MSVFARDLGTPRISAVSSAVTNGLLTLIACAIDFIIDLKGSPRLEPCQSISKELPGGRMIRCLAQEKNRDRHDFQSCRFKHELIAALAAEGFTNAALSPLLRLCRTSGRGDRRRMIRHAIRRCVLTISANDGFSEEPARLEPRLRAESGGTERSGCPALAPALWGEGSGRFGPTSVAVPCLSRTERETRTRPFVRLRASSERSRRDG